jgi:NTE family protein
MPQDPTTCLILGGGGARGLSHLGVLQVLERNGVRIDCVVGTSVGAVVGSAYALEVDAKLVTQQAEEYFKSEEFRHKPFQQLVLRSKDAEGSFFQNIFSSVRKGYVFSNLLRKRSILSGERLAEMIADLVPDRTFADTNLPFAVPALDVRSGEEVLLESGPLRPSVLASCSLPGFFPPVEVDGRVLADAGTIVPNPVTLSKERFRPTITIAVDICSAVEPYSEEATGLDLLLRVDSFACRRGNEQELRHADVVIRPDVGQQSWSDFSDFDGLVAQGALAAEAKLDELLAAQASSVPASVAVDESDELPFWKRVLRSLKG